MSLTTSTFNHAVHGLFELPSDDARRLLPARIEPLEPHHGSSLLSVSVFDFSQSPVGPYAELALSIIVAPQITDEHARWPSAAYFTFLMAANLPAAREQGGELPFPYWRDDVSIQLAVGEGCVQVGVAAEGASVIELKLYEHSWQPAQHRYQCLLAREGQRYLAGIEVDGEESEHEDGRGSLALSAHPLLQGLDIASIDETPVRETWIRAGHQTLTGLAAI
jgi:hypothetical protein